MPSWSDLYALMGDTPLWASYLIVSIVQAYTAVVFGVIVGKTGRSPFWGFAALFPFVALAMLALMVWGPWKRLPNRDYPASS